ncbi:hypothetical protein LLG95_05830 [bacterium]|nr:hypothetical protein [bacterium]
MNDKPPRRWRKWLLIGSAAAFGVPALVALFLELIFIANGIGPEQRTPPAAMIAHTNPSARAAAKEKSPDRFTQEKMLEGLRGRNPAAEKLFSQVLAGPLFSADRSNPFARQLPVATQAMKYEWIDKNLRDVIDRLLRLAKMLDGAPLYPFEFVEERGSIDVNATLPFRLETSAYYIRDLLFTEYGRRREKHDGAGAAEILLAMESLAESFAPPSWLNCLFSDDWRNQIYVEAARWLSQDPPSVEVALKLRDGFAKAKAPDYRRAMEIEYQAQRSQAVQILETPFWVRAQFGSVIKNFNPWLLADDVRDMPGGHLGPAAIRVYDSFRISANAGSLLKEYDERSRVQMERFSAGDASHLVTDAEFRARLNRPDERIKPYVPAFEYFVPVCLTTQARLNLVLAGLDELLKGHGGATRRIDPFTSATLSRIDKTSSTLIYSLGPDRLDQHGTIPYDPTNGNISPGDLTIRIPRR